MKKMLFILSLILANPASAFIKTGEKSISSAQQALKTAKKEGLGLTRHEQRIKNELQTLKTRDPVAFKERVFDGEASNPADYQSYLYEVMAGKSDVEKAKVMAQLEIFNAVKREWKLLQTTVLNETGIEDFETFKPALVHRLGSLMYAPIKKSSKIETNDYRFKIEDWGYAVVSKDLKKINWKITVSAANDGNKLEAGADKIRILDKNAPPPRNSGSDSGFNGFDNSLPDNGGGGFEGTPIDEDDSELLY